jgi:glycosyltransferase involved in cell wall biosynthesis
VRGFIAYTHAMRNVVVQLHRGEYNSFADYLFELGFEPLVLDVTGSRFMSRPRLFWQYSRGVIRLLLRSRQLRNAGTVITFGHFAYPVRLLARLRLVRYERMFCFAFFIHGTRWFRVFRWLARLDRANDFYVIFSRSEVDLYARQLGIDRERLCFVPLGDWGARKWQKEPATRPVRGDYYFAGGWSNRDYAALVKAFHSIPARLLIICSPANARQLHQHRLPPNVDVRSDVPPEVFEACVRGAKAGIIPLKLDTGASGQSVALALMRNAKCVIASDVGALREYVEPGVTGFLVGNMARELPGIIARLEADPHWAAEIGIRARERYDRDFSLNATSEAFRKLLGWPERVGCAQESGALSGAP